MDPPWSDGIYTSDVPRDFEEMWIREERKERIGQYWDLLVADQEPKVNKSQLLLLMQDLKDEGNTIFKEGHFDVAWMHYRNALFIARILETRFYHDVDKEFVSTLFSNRAFCCLKKEMYNEAIQDCEKAIEIHGDNIKAFYRQVQALKAQNRTAEALKIAQKGHLKQPNIFRELITELTEKLDSATSSRQQKPVEVDVSVKQASAVSSASNNVESEWLEGTNAFLPNKPGESSKKMSKKHFGKNGSKTKQQLVPSRNGQLFTDSESEQGSNSDDSLNNDENFASNFLNVRKPNFPVGVVSGKASTQPPQTQASRKLDVPQATSPTRQASSAMGLDQFSPPAGKFGVKTEKPVQEEDAGFSPVHKQATASARKTPTPTISQEDWDVLEFPLENYDFKLACIHCFVKTGEGVKGYKYRDFPHTCIKDYLLVKLRASPTIKTINWIRIRPRPESKTPKYTTYKICMQFSQGQPCRVGDDRCTFPHSKAETDLWNEDRNETFSITGFIEKLQELRIDNSSDLETFRQNKLPQQLQAPQPGIPGLNFKPKKTSASQLAKDHEALLRQTTTAKHAALTSSQSTTNYPSVHTLPAHPPPSANANMYSGSATVLSPQQLMSPPPVSATSMPPFNEPPPPEKSMPTSLSSSSQKHHLLPSPVMPNYSRPPPPVMASNTMTHYSPYHGGPFQTRYPPPRMPGPQGPNAYHQQIPYRYPSQYQTGYPPSPHLGHHQDGSNLQFQVRPNLVHAPVPKPASQITSDIPEESVTILQFPLRDTHDYKLFCKQCFVYGNYPGYYIHQPKTHRCEENILAVMEKTRQEWMRIRERKNHRDFPGKYIMCNSVYYGNSSLCRYGEEVCSFAHNKEEQFLWTLEKDDKFNITEFILQNRSQSTVKAFSLIDVLKKHGGYLDFICRACFYSTPRIISKQGGDDVCSGRDKHQWTEFQILAHFSPDGMVTIINPRGFLHKTAFFKICKWLQYCRNRINAECRFAHSFIERDIWMLERDSGMTREDIVREVNKTLGTGASNDTNTMVEQTTTTLREMAMPGATLPSQSPSAVVHTRPNLDEESDTLCPYIITAICQTCWKNGKKSVQDGDKDRCVKSHSNWKTNRIFLLATANREIRPLPRKIPQGFRFIICKFIKERGTKCGYTGGGHCQFAHSQDELEVWQWMCAHDLKSLDELYESSKEAQRQRASQVKSRIQGGELVVSTNKAKATLQIHTTFNPLYCAYCGKQCNSQKQWDEHCASERHNFNVNSDKEHQWNYRQPPWGMPGSNYEICSRHMNDGKCYYSHVPDMYNMCRYAHSQDELDEWKERFEWRAMKREMARQEMVFSYMDQLVEKFENSESGVKVITEDLDYATVSCVEDLIRYEEEKNATCKWVFEIKTQCPLVRVALLHNKDRLHFCLCGPGLDRNCQIAQGVTFEDATKNNVPCYRISVQFTASMFGSFSQWVIFDFGAEPVLVRKLSVEVGTIRMHEKVKTLREKLQFDRWTSETREIVKFEIDWTDELEKKLISRYKAPVSSESVITQNSLTDLNRNNYTHKMKKLLEMEEITRHQIIASYNLCVNIDLTDRIQEGTYVYAHPGVLFAKVPLSEYLTEDTDAGKLILTSVRKVLLAPYSRSDKVVYEASIVRKDNFDYDGRGKEHIYLCLSQTCVAELGLRKGSSIHVEIQFQMDRMSFCMMQYAVDQLLTTDIVFPDISKFRPQWNEKHTLKVSSDILNADQIQAIKHIVAERTGYTPPFVMYGPFGTGKTETIAQAAMVLLREKPESRILICAQSNSAADLYITKHLDSFLKKNPAKLRRIYFKERRANTVNPVVKNFCLLTPDKTAFAMPTKEDIENHQIVIVTLSTSLILTDLGMHGYFTHIFIDEAAQALEPETIMPLTLATEKTCVVLAGDQMQISPKVYSEEACGQKFNVSLLERLYQYYDSLSQRIDQTSPVNILLSINYRTKKEILRFISAIFYGGPDKLESQSNLPSVLTVTPLMFYAVQGIEVQDTDSTSFYNLSEIQEVVERVEELYHNWPQEWGPVQAKDIGVVTPYYDQVQLIRKALRKRHNDLRFVTVERINNVQGKEFRALFISTVRTRSLLDSPIVHTKNSDICESDGDFGFLTDPKLLNTALTRAQSFVAVIGDPIALCAIGECVNVWRTFLKHCQNMKSINPPSLTLESIRQQVSNLLNSPARERLQQIASQQKQDMSPTSSAKVEKVAPVAVGPKAQWSKGMGSAVNIPKLLNGQLGDLPRLPHPPDVYPSNYSQTECNIQPDEVIRQLAVEGKGEERDNIRVKEEDEQALIVYTTEGSFDSEDSEEEDPEVSGKVYTEQQLLDLLRTRKAQYKLCTLKIKAWSEIHAEVHDNSLPYSHIMITNRQRCGRAFNGDEVVVELLPNEQQDDSDRGMPHGQVVGILKYHVDPNNRTFVCSVAPSNTGLMIPINSDMPCIYNPFVKSHQVRVQNGYVCVYKLTTNKEYIFSEYVKVNAGNPSDRLFIVKYLTWYSQMSLPVGIVVGYMPAGDTIQKALQILDVEYQVPKKVFKAETEAEINLKYHHGYSLSSTDFSSRQDLRQSWTFTIDSPSNEEYSNAVSVEQLNDDNYLIGIHVADVSYFLNKGGATDTEAKTRGMTFSPFDHGVIHMLPPRLGTDLCSLKPGCDRFAISVFLTVSGTGAVLKVTPKKTVINTKKVFTYQEVQETLVDPNAGADYLKSCLLVLYHISLLWRKERLGNASKYQDMKIHDKMTPEAHIIVQELTHMTNHQVAKLLLDWFPSTTPVFCQKPPGVSPSNEWKQEHASDAVNSIALTKPFLEGPATCNCKLACTCIMNYIGKLRKKPRDPFDMYSVLWDSVCQAADSGEMGYAQSIVVDAESHPQLLLALKQLHEIQDEPAYICSGDAATDIGNYSLNLSPYVHFTNPLSRYMDIVVQRMVTAAIDGNLLSYSQAEIQDLCCQLNVVNIIASKYDAALYSVYLASALKARPVVLHPVIESIDNDHINLCFPLINDVPADNRSIELMSLKTCEKPVVDAKEASVHLHWQDRIYDFSVSNHKDASLDLETLNSNRFICRIPAFQWQKLLSAIREENMEKLQVAVKSVRPHVKQPANDSSFASDILVERMVDGKLKHFADFTMNLSMRGVIQVQMAAHICNGLLKPCLQLLNLTPTLDICLEHRDNPLVCFTTESVLTAAKPSYLDENDYQNSWLPVLAIEAAHNAVSDKNSVIIKQVKLQWQEEDGIPGSSYSSTFSLPLSFCQERGIILPLDVDLRKISQIDSRGSDSFFQDYVCVRYSGMEIPDDPALNESVALLVNNQVPVCWVGHCRVLWIQIDRDNVTLKLLLMHSSVSVPGELLKATQMNCTLEWMSKSAHDRRMQYAVQCLTSSSTLACDIACGRNPSNGGNTSKGADMVMQSLVSVTRLNESQTRAIRSSLTQPFTVIHGPPGSGKSLIAVRLAVLFSQLNSSSSGVVMLCGSSDISVNRLSEYLRDLGTNCPKILRVYGNHIEEKEFPVPGKPSPHNWQSAQEETSPLPIPDRECALHHVIRLQTKPYSQTINEYDMLFHMYADDITSDQVQEYRETVAAAKREELNSAQVILCTCSDSADIQINSAIKQIIIDDSGMCSEPETMIPIVNQKTASQVVVIGDHSQLRPEVKSDVARNLGLETSLLQRYLDKAVTLTTHYRMPETLAMFPSDYFYEDSLQVGSADQRRPSSINVWPGGQDHPYLFCHVIGKEEVTINPHIDGKSSYINNEEAQHVVLAARKLVSCGVAERDIVIICQYEAQCDHIKTVLQQQGYKQTTVTDVMACHGGQWDYVILTTVRSLPVYRIPKRPSASWRDKHLGYNLDSFQLNVAVSRAGKGLVIIGNKDLLCSDMMWDTLFETFQDHQAVIDAQTFLRLFG